MSLGTPFWVVVSPACLQCLHFHRTNLSGDTCDAFTDGIPAAIWQGKNDHTQPFPGDGGIMFEPIDAEIPLDRGDNPKALGSGA